MTTAIPPTEDPPGIVDSLNNLANKTGCNLLTVTPSDTDPYKHGWALHDTGHTFRFGNPQQRLLLPLRLLLDEKADDDQQRQPLPEQRQRQHPRRW